MTSPWLMAALSFPIGLCLGSYASTAAMRWARSEPSIGGRSHCDDCGVNLGWFQTLPVVSFVGRRGACGQCGAQIDPLHPAGELAGALILASSFAVLPIGVAPVAAGLGLVLLAAAIFDAKTRRLPDSLTLVAGLLCAGLALEHGPARLILGCAVAVAVVAGLETARRLFLKARGEPGLGFGDVKLIGVASIWLGLQTPWMITIASAAGLAAFALLKPSDRRLPFGPFIAAATFCLGLVLEARSWS